MPAQWDDGNDLRPASDRGIHRVGIKALAPSLDTVGVLTRSVDDAAFFIGALTRLNLVRPAPARLRVGLCRTAHWALADTDARAVFAQAARLLERAGAVVCDIDFPAELDHLTQRQIDIMGYEAAANFAPEAQTAADGFSAAFVALLSAGLAIDGERYVAAQDQADRARQTLGMIFNQVDVLLAPSVQGEAPYGIEATGDPIFNRSWTLLGNPCVHVPVGSGATGMPVGVTVIGPRHADALTLAAARLLEYSLS